MSENKTRPTDQNVTDFLSSVEHKIRRADGFALLETMQEITGEDAVLWGTSIVGFGSYHYKYESGREGDFLATGFSPRKANSTIYIMPGYQDFSEILSRLGKHKIGKSCLYINKLSDIDLGVLEELIVAGLKRLKEIHPDADC